MQVLPFMPSLESYLRNSLITVSGKNRLFKLSGFETLFYWLIKPMQYGHFYWLWLPLKYSFHGAVPVD